MSNFEKELLDIIVEKETVLFEIERVLFTKRYKLSQKHFEIFAVQSITMVYAIWEGFVQQACQLYISELNQQKIEFHRFSDGIVIFHMESKFRQLREYPDKDKRKTAFYLELEQFFANKHHDLSSTINTESNVGFEVLNKILNKLSLETFTPYWENYQHPTSLEQSLTNFLRYRNGVAHGGDTSSEEKVTHDVYVKYKNMVVDLMYGIHSRMITGLDEKSYLK